jgi:hypothetical protein
MDDRDLEARLRKHLHARLDDAAPHAELSAAVAQIFAAEPRRLGLPSLRVVTPIPRLSFAALVMVLVVGALAAGVGFRAGPFAGAPSPTPTTPPSRSFIVLPPSPEISSKGEATLAGDVLMARLRALGLGTFTMSGGYGMTFDLPAGDRPDDATIRAVLGAAGDVAFVGLPARDYNSPGFGETGDKLDAVVGQPLPKAEPVLFDRSGIYSITAAAPGGSQDVPVIHVVVTAAELSPFAAYTSAHVGEGLAVLIDGRVALVARLMEPILDGQIDIGAPDDAEFARARAILVGGPLPEAWRGAPVPAVISRATAIDHALQGERPGTRVVSADLQALLLGIGRWTAVWNVVLEGSFPACPPLGPEVATCGPAVDTELVVLDGATGGLVQREAPAPEQSLGP